MKDQIDNSRYPALELIESPDLTKPTKQQAGELLIHFYKADDFSAQAVTIRLLRSAGFGSPDFGELDPFYTTNRPVNLFEIILLIAYAPSEISSAVAWLVREYLQGKQELWDNIREFRTAYGAVLAEEHLWQAACLWATVRSAVRDGWGLEDLMEIDEDFSSKKLLVLSAKLAEHMGRPFPPDQVARLHEIYFNYDIEKSMDRSYIEHLGLEVPEPEKEPEPEDEDDLFSSRLMLSRLW